MNNEQKLARVVIASIIVYATLHLLEEGLMGFPAWVEKNWGIPGYNLERWLIHNYFFLGAQLFVFGLYLHSAFQKHYLGLGIPLWGTMNSINHVFFTIIKKTISPGVFTSFLFVFLLFYGVKLLRRGENLDRGVLLQALLVGVFLWVAPIALFLLFDIYVMKIV